MGVAAKHEVANCPHLTQRLLALQVQVLSIIVFVEFTEADPFSLGGQSRLEVSTQLILSGCTYEA